MGRLSMTPVAGIAPVRRAARRAGGPRPALAGLATLAALGLLAGCGSGEAGPVESVPPASAQAADDRAPWLVEVTERLVPGFDPGGWPDGVYFLPEIMQGGVAVLDHDGDGDLDILQARIPPPGTPHAPAPNRLWSRQDDGSYREVSDEAGLDDAGFGQAIAVGDVDNDGDADVYFANYGRDALYINEGGGRYREVTAAAGFEGERWSTGATFCDYDRDGWLDLYVVHYVRHDPDFHCQDEAGRREYCGPQVYHGEPDRLYRNNGDGTFSDVTSAAGIELPEGGERARGMAVVCIDLSGDGLADFYVANDAESNQLWVNRGDGSFVDQAVARGVAVNRHGKPEASMGVTVGDVDGDGSDDLFMTHLFQEHNTLYTTGRGALFFDSTLESGLAVNDWELTGFGCGLFDADNDGDLDLAVANGRVRRGRLFPGAAGGEFWSRYAEPNMLYENEGGGRFRHAPGLSGAFGGAVEVSRGLAFGDLDDDGDVDVVQSNVDNTLRVFRNDAPVAGRHSLRVRVLTRGRDALGARVVLRLADRSISRLAIAGYSYGSSSEPRVHFGLDDQEVVEGLEVHWPDGAVEAFPIDGIDRQVVLSQGRGNRR